MRVYAIMKIENGVETGLLGFGGAYVFKTKRDAIVRAKKGLNLTWPEFHDYKIVNFNVEKDDYIDSFHVLGGWHLEKGKLIFRRSQWQGD